MKPFVAIDGVLDNLFFKVYRCTSVENCAQTENLYCLFEVVPGPAKKKERKKERGILLSRTASNRQYRFSVWAQSAFKMP